MAQQSTFAEELMAAGRGVIGLLIGDRRAGGFFDFSRRGLVGSFIALLLVTALTAVIPTLLGSDDPGDIGRSTVSDAILFATAFGSSAIVLTQLKRIDGYVPYLVASNWATFFVELVAAAVAAAGVTGVPLVIVFLVVVILIEVNILRFIVTLAPLQIALFLVAEFVGLALASLIVTSLFPPAPELAAQLAALAG